MTRKPAVGKAYCGYCFLLVSVKNDLEHLFQHKPTHHNTTQYPHCPGADPDFGYKWIEEKDGPPAGTSPFRKDVENGNWVKTNKKTRDGKPVFRLRAVETPAAESPTPAHLDQPPKMTRAQKDAQAHLDFDVDGETLVWRTSGGSRLYTEDEYGELLREATAASQELGDLRSKADSPADVAAEVQRQVNEALANMTDDAMALEVAGLRQAHDILADQNTHLKQTVNGLELDLDGAKRAVREEGLLRQEAVGELEATKRELADALDRLSDEIAVNNRLANGRVEGVKGAMAEAEDAIVEIDKAGVSNKDLVEMVVMAFTKGVNTKVSLGDL